MDEEVYIRTPSHKVSLGRQSDVRLAANEILWLTGGSSGGGRWSFVFRLMDAQPEHQFPDDEILVRIAHEADDLRGRLGNELSPAGRAFLDRLANLA